MKTAGPLSPVSCHLYLAQEQSASFPVSTRFLGTPGLEGRNGIFLVTAFISLFYSLSRDFPDLLYGTFQISEIAHKTSCPPTTTWDTYCDILQRGIDDLIVVGKAVKLERVEVEEDMVAELDTVDVGMRLQAPACGEGKGLADKGLERHSLLFIIL